jgi:hypothetical protein
MAEASFRVDQTIQQQGWTFADLPLRTWSR